MGEASAVLVNKALVYGFCSVFVVVVVWLLLGETGLGRCDSWVKLGLGSFI